MDESRHVRKSNIFTEGRYRFSVNEQRILLSIISKIRIDEKEFKAYRLNWKYLRKVTKNKFSNADEYNALCENLKNRTVLVKEGDKIHGYGFLSGWTIDPGKYIDFRIDECMRGHLLDLLREGRFTLYRLECILSLSSTYSIRLYELLKSHEWKNQPVELPLSEVKWALGVTEGTKIDKRFDLFRTKVLEKARKDLSTHTDLKFTYKKVLELRKVVALQFNIQENTKYQKTVTSVIGKKETVRDGDRILIAGKEYQIHGDHIVLEDGIMPIGRINQLLEREAITKL